MAQDVVGGCDVEKELRHAESNEKGFASKFSLRAIAEGENHLLFSGTVDLSRPQAPDKFYRGRDTRLEFGDVRFDIRKSGI
jgi:hypothetical protein